MLFVLFCVLFMCKCVLYYCHWVSTQMQLINISYSLMIQTTGSFETFIRIYQNARHHSPKPLTLFLKNNTVFFFVTPCILVILRTSIQILRYGGQYLSRYLNTRTAGPPKIQSSAAKYLFCWFRILSLNLICPTAS
jgi:hypothetical protein